MILTEAVVEGCSKWDECNTHESNRLDEGGVHGRIEIGVVSVLFSFNVAVDVRMLLKMVLSFSA